MRRKRHPEINLLTAHATRYLSLSFIDLVQRMRRIEEELTTQAQLSVLDYLAANGSEIRGDTLVMRDHYYQLLVRLDEPGRTLRIDIIALDRTPHHATSHRSHIGFGVVRRIEITGPTEFRGQFDDMLERVAGLYSAAYTGLENAYLSSYAKWISDLFADVYMAINTQLQILGRDDVRNRFWISVTAMKSESFRYHFSAENLRHAVAWLKQSPTIALSPASAATMLLTQEMPDGVIGAPKPQSVVAYDERTRVIEFSSLPTLGEHTAFWISERSLFGSNTLTALHIVTINNQAFELNFPIENLDAMRTALTTLEADLPILIRNRYRGFRKDQRTLRTAILHTKDVTGVIQEIGVDITAKVIAEILKPS